MSKEERVYVVNGTGIYILVDVTRDADGDARVDLTSTGGTVIIEPGDGHRFTVPTGDD